jgi:signal transduction histidine kinase
MRFDRYYPQFRRVTHPTREALLVPFFAGGEAVGALWVVSHDDTREFDMEDLRLLTRIVQFASHLLGLAVAAEKRRQAERIKDNFVATLVHELRAPLEPLRNRLTLLQAARGDLSIVAQAYLIMERQLALLTRMVDDLLDVDRIRLGKVRLNVSRTEIATIVRNAVEISRPGIERRGHEFVIELPAEPILVNVDGGRLVQVLANLLNNAAKYTEDQGRICLVVARRGSDVEVAVRDNGIGISPRMLPASSTCSRRPTTRSTDRTAGWASDCTSPSASWSCTGVRSGCIARAKAGEASSSSPCGPRPHSCEAIRRNQVTGPFQ